MVTPYTTHHKKLDNGNNKEWQKKNANATDENAYILKRTNPKNIAVSQRCIE